MSGWWEVKLRILNLTINIGPRSLDKNFRLPYASYVMILDMISSTKKSEGLFDRWTQHDNSCYAERENNKKNKKVSPIKLLLLGSLIYLGKGWMFDDMRAVTYISRDVHRKFFHQFVSFGATVLYPTYVSVPQTVEELQDCGNEYNIAGFLGCIGSTDAAHIPLEKVCVSLRQAHLGFKSKSTIRTYNLSYKQSSEKNLAHNIRPPRWME